MKLLKEKIMLGEDFDKVNGDVEVLPDVIPEEPIVVSTEVEEEKVPEDIVKGVHNGLINDLMRQQFDLMEAYRSAISTLTQEDESTKQPYTEDVISVLNSALDEESIIVGMLTKASELIDGNAIALMQQGEQKAEEILASEEFPVDESLKLKED